jgi:hypothetical protein
LRPLRSKLQCLSSSAAFFSGFKNFRNDFRVAGFSVAACLPTSGFPFVR